jgi:hypothetical protein
MFLFLFLWAPLSYRRICSVPQQSNRIESNLWVAISLDPVTISQPKDNG